MSELKTNKIQTNDTNNVAIDNALQIKGYTESERDALSNPQAGDVIYNEDNGTIDFYNGSSWNATSANTFETPISYLVIAGGGGGGGSRGGNYPGSAGGAGGYRNSYGAEFSGDSSSTETPLGIIKGTSYAISVGGGGSLGTGVDGGVHPTAGTDSQFGSVTSTGGGARASGISPSSNSIGAGTGGSGAGGRGSGTGYAGIANQGGDGGDGSTSSSAYGAGGGGGASGNGSNGSGSAGGAGGNGLTSYITGSGVTRAGGGGGGSHSGSAGAGGSGGGSAGTVSATNASNATTNTGSGGGSAGKNNGNGGAGGSGIVILRWTTADATISATRTGLVDGGVQTDGTSSYIIFTGGSGNVSWS
tara:strand:+ start:596 stop:1675 length:1080 start_codon:yes stop_codon:yes gene_type:complete